MVCGGLLWLFYPINLFKNKSFYWMGYTCPSIFIPIKRDGYKVIVFYVVEHVSYSSIILLFYTLESIGYRIEIFCLGKMIMFCFFHGLWFVVCCGSAELFYVNSIISIAHFIYAVNITEYFFLFISNFLCCSYSVPCFFFTEHFHIYSVPLCCGGGTG